MASPSPHSATLITTKSETLTLDSTELHRTALTDLSQQTLAPSKAPSSIPSTIPPSKIIPNTRFLVDAFRFPSASDFTAAFFLSHFHSDHYSGLSSSWNKGIVFCSQITGRLLVEVLKVSSEFVYLLPSQQAVTIDGCEATLIDANHCPGAVQFLFKVPLKDGEFERYVHTGDCRFCESMKYDASLSSFVGCDAIFLDTTYCNPKFVFPLQEESVEYVANVIDKKGGEFSASRKSVLFLVATYVIGKEKILIEVARRCKRKIYVDARKMSILRVLGYGESGVFTEDETESDVHVVGWNMLGETWPYFRPNFVKIKEIMIEKGYDKVVGFVPTGWTYEVKHNKFAVRSKDSFEIHLVPYSEHSNYEELREYVKYLKPKKVVPTVGIDVEKLDSKHVNKMQKHFSGLVDEMANKKQFLMGFYGESCEKDKKIETGVSLRQIGELDLDKNSSETKAVENNDGSVGVQDNLSKSLEPSSRDSTILASNEETEKIIMEIHDCLPTWVTRDQILGLMGSLGSNIVEVVSNFYERETEFYEQVFASTSSVPASQVSLLDDQKLPLKQDVVKSTPPESPGIHLTLSCKSPNMKIPTKNSISPGKRKKPADKKPNKKAKHNFNLEPTGAKQSTITKFFNKVLPGRSQAGVACSKTKEGSMDENLVPSNVTTSYKAEIDQFIGIVNGNESLRRYAADILEKTKGDISMGLDIYYSNPEGNCHQNAEKLILPGKSIQVQCFNSNNDQSNKEKKASEESRHVANSPILGQQTQDLSTAPVSLPPEKYRPIEHACWKGGHPAPYIHLARTFDLVECEKGKNRASSMLCNMFRSLLALSPEDVLSAVYLCTNKIAPDHERIELNIGGSLVTSALEEACGTKRSTIKDMYNKLGDLGDVAQVCRQTQTLLALPPPLLIRDVFSTFHKISLQTGSESTMRKKSLIVNLMRSCREKEIKFLVRTLVRNLRIGAMIRTVLPALAQAVVMNSSNSLLEETSKNIKEKLQGLSAAVVEAYNVLPSFDLVVPSLLEKGIGFSASTLSMVPGVPIKPMLAKITNGVPQALKLFQNKAFICEYKYDGQRAQIHKLLDGSVRVFSRNGVETTSRFPDLIDIINKSCKPSAETYILDAEVVAVDRKNGCKLMSFQELSSRKRGGKDSFITADSIKVEICVFVFDIMFANGEQLLGFPLRQRRTYLKDLFHDQKFGYFEYAKEIIVESEDACLNNEAVLMRINSFLEEAFHSSCEGIMVKSLDVDAGYCPSKRPDTWLKVKQDYIDGMIDSLDLVPIGAWHGNGRKAGWYSPFLMACYNPETEEFQSVCRVMSGFSNSFYTEMKEFYSGDKILSRKPPYYRTAETPDTWFSPELVWEIRGSDFTVSPVHQAAIGLVHPSRGISIRFPRFVQPVTDRSPEECSTAADVAEMFNSQTRKMDLTAKD